VEERLILDRRLTQDTDDLGAGLLTAAPEVGRRDLGVAEQPSGISGIQATGAEHRVPLLHPPAQLSVVVDRHGIAEPSAE